MSKLILTVDDSASIRKMMGFTLRNAGYDVLEAHNGKEALEKLCKPVALVVTDLNMPAMNGIELVKALRSHTEFRFIPVLMLFTRAQLARKQEALTAGASAWLAKPFKPERLVDVVRSLAG